MDNRNIIFDNGEPNFSYNTVVTDEDLNDRFVDESGVYTVKMVKGFYEAVTPQNIL